jgi:anti-sigma factor RsiW
VKQRDTRKHLSAERMQAFLDGELPSGDAAAIEEHLVSCARCSAELDGWRVLFEDLGGLGELGPEHGFAERVMAGVTLPGAGEHVAPGLLLDFLDGELATRRARKVEAHLRACPACTAEADDWLAVMQRLNDLDRFRPSADFPDRVMEHVDVRERLPLAARLRTRLAAVAGGPAPEHVPGGILQDFVDGTLPSRAVARVEAHVGSCSKCAGELRAWRSIEESLTGLAHLAPTPGFAERVMAEVSIQQTAKALTPVSFWWRAGAAARRLVPQTREAWAALSGAAVTPAVIVGLVAWAVFSHPTLTLGSLASFVAWQVVDFGSAVFSGASGAIAQAVDAVGARGLLDALASAPLMMAGAGLVYVVLCVLALRILYKNLFTRRSLGGRYAHGALS